MHIVSVEVAQAVIGQDGRRVVGEPVPLRGVGQQLPLDSSRDMSWVMIQVSGVGGARADGRPATRQGTGAVLAAWVAVGT